MRRHLILFALVALVGSCKSGLPPVEFLRRVVKVGDVTYRYRVYVPKDRQAGQKLPVLLYLHGSGSRGTDNESQIIGFNKFIAENPQNFNFIIVFPQGRSETFWDTAMLEQATAALDQTVKEFDGDEKRLFVSGFSLGGVGTWHAALLYPQKFAAIVPIAGRITPMEYEVSNTSPAILAMANSDDPYKAFAEKLKNTPTWIFHGGKDESMPVDLSRKMYEALKQAGNNNVHYTEFEGMGHYSVEAAFNTPELFEWLAKQKLDDTK